MRSPTGAETVISRSRSPTKAEADGDRRMGLHPRSRGAKPLPSALRIVTRMDAWFSVFRAEGIRKSPPENYGKEDQTTVAAFLPWRGSSAPNPYPLTERKLSCKIDIVQSRDLSSRFEI